MGAFKSAGESLVSNVIDDPRAADTLLMHRTKGSLQILSEAHCTYKSRQGQSTRLQSADVVEAHVCGKQAFSEHARGVCTQFCRHVCNKHSFFCVTYDKCDEGLKGPASPPCACPFGGVRASPRSDVGLEERRGMIDERASILGADFLLKVF